MDLLFDLLAAFARKLNPSGEPPFSSHDDLLATIDATPTTMPSWESFKVRYSGELPTRADPPSWMLEEHTIWYRDPKRTIEALLKNPDFRGEMAYSPYREYNNEGKRVYKNLMSGDWAWTQAVRV